MTARYRIDHRTTYTYDHAVTSSFNEVRLTPGARPWQTPLESVLRVEQATWQHRFVDYWGTEVRAVEAHTTHRELVIDMTSLVEVDASRRDPVAEGLSWDDLSDFTLRQDLSEFLALTGSTRPPEDLARLARQIADGSPPHRSALAIASAVHEAMTYVPGSTGVQTPAADAWLARTGVCQDYAHLVVGALRHVGIPARYVSGYLHPVPDPAIGEISVAESHAWVQFWSGGWVDNDPTNLADVGERHVLVGTGRDYQDVPPIKGIVAGTPLTTDLQVEVAITRVG